jgi:hypothetical protein
MATSKNGKKAQPLNMALLAAIVTAGADGMFVSPTDSAPLVAAKLVEVNPAVVDASGALATRATPEGIALVNSTNTNGAAAAPAAASTGTSKFAIDTGIEMPASAARGRTATTYPFDALQVGQSFFVPNTTEKPNAAKSLASTVSSANQRYAVPAEGTRTDRKGNVVPNKTLTRTFVVRPVDESAQGRGAGARVWRTA